MKNNLDPEWNEKFTYEHQDGENPVIVFAIYDQDKAMGVVKIPLISLADGKVLILFSSSIIYCI